MQNWWQSVAIFLASLSGFHRALLAVGVALFIAGLVIIARTRRLARSPERQAKAAGPWDSLSTPTQTVIGLSVLIMGYHMAAWALPLHWSAVKVSPDWWWLVPLISVTLITASIAIDRAERNT